MNAPAAAAWAWWSAWARCPAAWLALVLLWAGTGSARAADPPSLMLPAAATDLAAALDFEATTPRAHLLVDVVRAVHSAPAGRSRESDDLRTRLASWLRAAPATPEGAVASRLVPAVIAPDRWTALLPGQPRGSALPAAILLDRQAALTYLGLFALDTPTLAFVAGHPTLLESIYASHAPVFAAFAGSVRLVDRHVATPGDEASWEALAGVSPRDPAEFILRLLSADRGRLAYLFDALVRLDPPRQRFALRSAAGDAKARREALRSLARAFSRASPDWHVHDHPFLRPTIDPALVLAQLAVDERGEFRGPRATAFWMAVFEREWSRRRDRPVARDLQGQSADLDAPWLVASIAEPDPDTRMARLRAVQFVQRVFGEPRFDAWPDVAIAAEGALRDPALPLVLERIGVTDPAVFARATIVAGQLAASGAQRLDLALVQAALAVIDRARFVGSLGAPQAAALSASLLEAVPLDGEAAGWVGPWIDDALLPALAVGATAPAVLADAERVVVAALAGRAPRTGIGPPVVEWEGVEFEVDPAAAELLRLQSIRQRQASVSLDHAVQLHRHVRAIAAPGAVPVAERLKVIEAFAAAEPVMACPDPGPRPAPCSTVDLVKDAVGRLSRSRGAPARTREGREATAALARVADAALADALVGLAYAVHLGHPGDAVTLAPDVARRHDLGVSDRPPAASGALAWSLPREVVSADVPWHVSGSILALDHALAALALRRRSALGMPAPSRLPQAEVLALARGAVRMPAHALSDADRDWAAGALRGGRARVESMLRQGDFAALGEVGWPQWRVNALEWSLLVAADEAGRLFTSLDHLLLGVGQPRDTERLGPWGGSEVALAASLENRWPWRSHHDEVQRPAAGVVGGRSVEATLRVIDFTAAHGLPAGLVPSLTALALADLLWEARLAHAYDGFALASRATSLDDERLRDYVTALTVDGPLVDPGVATRRTQR